MTAIGVGSMAIDLKELVSYCDTRLRTTEISDFPGSRNGLQVQNSGKVTRIGAAVDAGMRPFEMAREAGIDFLIVHHGLFWTEPLPITGLNYTKIRALFEGNIALYSNHLPLDCHPELGNNALLAREIGLKLDRFIMEHEGTPLAGFVSESPHRTELRQRLERCFPTVVAIEEGPSQLKGMAIITGSGGSAIPHLKANGVDTLITGELKQNHFNMAQELELNLYVCGHYATEVFGVKALAAELSDRFGLPWSFLDTGCPL